MPGPGYKRQSLPGPSKVSNPVSAVSSAVKSFASSVKQGSVSSGSVPPTAYGGQYASYAPTSTATAPSGPSAAEQARAQARQQRRQKQANQARKKVAQMRKARSGQDIKRTKQVLRDKAKLTPKQAKATAPVVANSLKRVASKAPKQKAYPFVPYSQRNTVTTPLAALKAREAGEQATATVRSLKSPAATKARRTARRGAAAAERALKGERGLTQPKPRKVAKRLQKAVKKAEPKGRVPEVVPPQYRDEVAKYGKMLDPVVPKGMSGSEYLGKLIQFESGWNPEAQNPSGATGLGQFMPYTRETFKNEYGVDPYGSPEQAIKAAAMHASGKYGHSPLYAGYNPGYSDTDPIPSVDGGKLIGGGKSKPIPTKLKRTARQTLGKKPTKAILKGGKVVRDPKADKDQPSKADQRWGGAVGAIHAVLPKEYWPDARGDKRTPAENASVGGSSTSDHLTTNTNSFAADLPADDALARKIADNLGLESHTGTQTVEKDGVRYQLIWQDEGHYDHVHLGALVTDPSKAPFAADPNIPIKGTKLAVKMPMESSGTDTASAGATSFAGSTSGSAPTSAPTSGSESKKAKSKARQRRRYRNYSPYADLPSGYYSIDPETYEGDPFLARLAELSK